MKSPIWPNSGQSEHQKEQWHQQTINTQTKKQKNLSVHSDIKRRGKTRRLENHHSTDDVL